MPYYSRQTSRLHHGRFSTPHARYFVTFVRENRRAWFADISLRVNLLGILKNGHNARNWDILTATCMPDHVHVLLELGVSDNVYGNIGRCVACWKTLSRRMAPRGEGWQRDFWEHRVRPDESVENYARYIFMNSYRARLLACDAGAWDGTWIPESRRFEFLKYLNPKGGPPVEWLGDLEAVVVGAGE